ncbi:uncharacterized protein SPPG_06425 [Spizellomyces punctatus DAOM BR117]|uniref:Uncharacterized protein n=1 Tax=Spizellomyces punctatus (strain DAOM BR117) TaxID=645134 RepID=A0A0L0HAG9_SPIPD|nr:uncharacterized protein SPPG_06425 [Spizellomyces punctatus DAOM BR117]KNC98006.1 hypothetical protein SPPG_06425 [Spizellomyces punctatus DAOM BR117]|eukprot:XP_016606046.1 hypothetical protein SPPG_06425 [Spizellomyces punctatus DAOM BR117]
MRRGARKPAPSLPEMSLRKSSSAFYNKALLFMTRLRRRRTSWRRLTCSMHKRPLEEDSASSSDSEEQENVSSEKRKDSLSKSEEAHPLKNDLGLVSLVCWGFCKTMINQVSPHISIGSDRQLWSISFILE